MAQALNDLTAHEAAAKIEAGEITSEALTQACLDRIAEAEEAVGAWAFLDPEIALAQARALDGGPRRGLIHGVPFGLKDIIDTSDMPTGYGSPIYEGHRVAWDAPGVAGCRAAGGVVLGKTVSTEFAHRHPGGTRNPHNPEHTPGGSSSGSAAAVGAHMVPVAFGTQTTGSIIRPAAYCGTVGYKPSYGDFSATGVRDNTPSFDTLGLIARGVEDLALFRSVVMALPYRPVAPVSLGDLTIGVCRTVHWEKADAPTQALIDGTASALSQAGARVADFAMPEGESGLGELIVKVSGFEFSRVMMDERMRHADRLSRVLLEGRVADGIACSYEDYRAAQRLIAEYRRRFDAAMEGIDMLFTPAAPGEAPQGLASTGEATFNGFWTTLHVPAVTLPAGSGPGGLPLGVQLIGHRHRDPDLLDAAKAVTAVLPTGA